MDRKERSALIASPALSGRKIVAVRYGKPTESSGFEVVNSDGTRFSFDMNNPSDWPDLAALTTRLGLYNLSDSDELVGQSYDGDGLTDEQREAASLAREAEAKRIANGLHFKFSAGGSMGGNEMLMLDGKHVGHLYIDASDGVDAEQVLVDIAKRYNMHSALVAALSVVDDATPDDRTDGMEGAALVLTWAEIDAIRSAILAAQP